jgi:hypothetical protein
MRNTCTDKGDFARSLMRLGKQNGPAAAEPRPATALERRILSRYDDKGAHNSTEFQFMTNPVFLFELTQLSDGTGSERFRRDFQRFMGLRRPLPPPRGTTGRAGRGPPRTRPSATGARSTSATGSTGPFATS